MSSMDTLKRHLPISGPEGLHELRKIVERFEEKIYSTATSQMLTMETKSFNATTNSLPSNSAGHNKKSPNDKKSPARKKPSDPGRFVLNRVWKQSVAASFLPSSGLEG
ncbi:Mediator of RNA polymerase II transcription subunit 15a [Vitis vinifera]|uniref:Mediator of RNA polymerase II transcription subunit 15a n=1 Tax=Vitis vinifera TaxID=29760 RepID=A0A438BNC0_VITVI|nr:Mediator of RNA polymerase II transcription subunit 15a [Vitis vinifera]